MRSSRGGSNGRQEEQQCGADGHTSNVLNLVGIHFKTCQHACHMVRCVVPIATCMVRNLNSLDYGSTAVLHLVPWTVLPVHAIKFSMLSV
eukprot:SAG31_NODE_37138_length_307_cov_0.480769_1_plen_89_part_10